MTLTNKTINKDTDYGRMFPGLNLHVTCHYNRSEAEKGLSKWDYCLILLQIFHKSKLKHKTFSIFELSFTEFELCASTHTTTSLKTLFGVFFVLPLSFFHNPPQNYPQYSFTYISHTYIY